MGDLTWETVQVRLGDLIPNPDNPKYSEDENVNRLNDSVDSLGLFETLVVDYDGKSAVDGHQRLNAWLEHKGEDFIVDARKPSRALTGEEIKKIILYSGKGTVGSWDFDMLTSNFEPSELTDWGGFDMDDLGIEPEVEEGLTDDDEVPDVPEDPVTVLGDIWLLGDHRLMCGDSTSIDAVENMMGGVLADLLHTDPPYNVNYSNASRPKASKTDFGKIKNDAMSPEEFYEFLLESFKAGYVFLKQDSTSYIWHASSEHVNFTNALVDAGFIYTQQIIWKKPMLLGRGRYQWAHEPCLMGVKGSPYFTDDRTKTTVWDFGGYDKSKNLHPTQKPLFIPEEAIYNSSKIGSIVLDLFGGSGSTLIACEKTSRTGRIMELDPKYCDVIVSRWESYTGKEATLESSGKTFAEMKKERVI